MANPELTQHPLSAAFPGMPEDEFTILCDDIKANGLRAPITMFEGQVIDGWHRYRGCLAGGILPKFVGLPDGADPVSFVKSMNLHRRHMNASQRAMAVVQCSNWAPIGTNQHTAARVGTGCLPSATVQKMAADADVSARTIRQAKAVEKEAPREVVEAVKAGKVSVKAADASLKRKKKKAKKPAAVTLLHMPRASGQDSGEPEADGGAADLGTQSMDELIDELQRENASLHAQISAIKADDPKAEALKWRKAYDNAVREQSAAMDRASKAADREAWTARQLRRCGKVVGQDDPSKIAAAVEAFVRQHSKAAA